MQQLKAFLSSNFYFVAVADLITERITAAAYQQYLQAFLSAELSQMARDFGVGEGDLGSQLEYFIFQGDVLARMDAVKGVVQKI